MNAVTGGQVESPVCVTARICCCAFIGDPTSAAARNSVWYKLRTVYASGTHSGVAEEEAADSLLSSTHSRLALTGKTYLSLFLSLSLSSSPSSGVTNTSFHSRFSLAAASSSRKRKHWQRLDIFSLSFSLILSVCSSQP